MHIAHRSLSFWSHRLAVLGARSLPSLLAALILVWFSNIYIFFSFISNNVSIYNMCLKSMFCLSLFISFFSKSLYFFCKSQMIVFNNKQKSSQSQVFLIHVVYIHQNFRQHFLDIHKLSFLYFLILFHSRRKNISWHVLNKCLHSLSAFWLKNKPIQKRIKYI